MKEKIAIIGAGNMGQAIVRGLLGKKLVHKKQLFLTNSKTKNNNVAVQKANVVIFAVKPQVAISVLEEIKHAVKDQLVISVMAGITMDTTQKTLGEKVAVVRVMPNLGARVGKSMSVWVANEFVTYEDKVKVRQILGSIGKEIEVENEDLIDAATAISGSGLAYFFYFVEQLSLIGQQFGFSKQVARLLAEQTLIGAAGVLANATEDAAALRGAVTSKGGTTEAAVRQFEAEMLDVRFRYGVEAARRRAAQLRIK